MTSRQIIHRSFIAVLLLATAPHGFASDSSEEKFKTVIRPFLAAHCVQCHGPDTQEADLALHRLKGNFAKEEEGDIWAKVLEQLHLEAMPPAEETQPNPAVRQEFMAGLQIELAHVGIELDQERLRSPEFGNYVDHHQLFDGSVEEMPATVSRLWLTKPVSGVREGHFKDYAALKKLDEPATQRELRLIEEDIDNVIRAIAEDKRWYRGHGRVTEVVKVRRNRETKMDLESKQPATREQIEADVRCVLEALGYLEPSADKIARYADYVETVASADGNEVAFRGLMMVLALDPARLYRAELGRGAVDEHGRRLLSPQEIVSAYEYLFNASGVRVDLEQLKTTEGIEQYAQEVVDNRHSMDSYRKFFREYFDYIKAVDVFKGERHARHHIHQDSEIGPVMVNELEALIYRTLQEDQDVLKRLLTTDRMFVSLGKKRANYDRFHGMTSVQWAEPALESRFRKGFNNRLEHYRSDKLLEDARWAREHAVFDWGWHLVDTKESNPLDRRNTDRMRRRIQERIAFLDYYGLKPTPEDIDRVAAQLVELPRDDDDSEEMLRIEPMKSPVPRAGVLTHPAWLLANSTFDHNDVVKRGKWIRERLLGGSIPDVPIGVNAAVPQDKDKTLRERMHVTREQFCWRCHVKMDPLGLPFEIYDDFARYREDGKERRPDGEFVPLDSSGEIVNSGDPSLDGKVSDAVELAHRLADSEHVRQVFVRHVFRFFLGRNETLRDSKTLIEADQAYVESGGSFKALVHSLITSDSFLYRIDP